MFSRLHAVVARARSGSCAILHSMIPVLVLLAVPWRADAAAQNTVSVGTARAAAGQTAYGMISIPAGRDTATDLPVAVINGVRPGRTLAIISGSHGTEYASIVAASRLISRIDPRLLTGTVIVMPLLNIASMEQMTVHINPIDRKGMNGQYPGDANGTQTQRALAAVTQEVLSKADVVLDLHGGDIDEDLRPYSYWTRTGNARQDSASRALVLAFGLDHIIVRDLDITNPTATRSLSSYSLSKGKIALVAEAGHYGTVDAVDVDALIEGTLNLMGALRMIERSFTPLQNPVWVGGGSRVAAERTGMFFPTVSRGSYVSAGMKVGYTTDYLGRGTAEIKAPESGIVTFIRGVPSMPVGATLVAVSPVLANVR